jgi:hypothetical protein
MRTVVVIMGFLFVGCSASSPSGTSTSGSSGGAGGSTGGSTRGGSSGSNTTGAGGSSSGGSTSSGSNSSGSASSGSTSGSSSGSSTSGGSTSGGSSNGGTSNGGSTSSIVLETDGDTTSPTSSSHLSFTQGTLPGYLDVVTWQDANTQNRTTTFVDNNAQPGGVASQLTYQDVVAGQAVTLDPAIQGGNPVDGYGYVVSHYGGGYQGDPNCAMNGDDNSPVAQFQGTTRVVFQGRNHLIYEITLQYPREGQDGVCYRIPITIDWVFAAGRSYPVYAITWDVAGSGAGGPTSANPLYPADSRAPYGAMRVDGSGNDYIEFNKVSWADDVYSFETTSSPSSDGAVCMNSAWTWNTRSNGFPFVELDAASAVRSFAIMATNSGQYMHAGGYADSVQAGTDGRGTTSAARGSGVFCDSAAGGDGIDVAGGPFYIMPCVSDGWPFQSLNYELAYAPPSTMDDTFTDTPTAPMVDWGTDYFIGTTISGAQTAEGLSATAKGVTLAAPPADAVGYPEASYSTYIVYGPTTEVSGFAPLVAEVPTAFAPDGTTTTAVTTCPAGAGRTDTIPCQPANYDQTYAAIRVNSVDGAHFGFTSSAGSNLSQLTVVVEHFTGTVIPATLAMAGTATALADGTDYFASLRSSTSELWITFGNVPVTGAITGG